MLKATFETIWLTEILMLVSVLVMFMFFGSLLKTMHRQQARLWPVILILLLGLGLRFYWIHLTQPLPESDFAVYWQSARQFYQGDLSFPHIERHPGIILLYTFIFHLLGPTLWSAWIMNLIFSAVFLLALYQLTRELYGPRAGLLTMGVAAIFPQFVTYTALLATETAAAAYGLLIIRGALQAQAISRHRLLHWAGLGFLMYGSALIRSSSLLFLLLIPVAALLIQRVQWKRVLSGWLVMAATTALLLSTWIAHQYVLTGVPKLFFGGEIWLAFATQYDKVGATGQYSDLPYYAKYREAIADGTLAGRIRGYKVLEEESLKIIRRDPVQYLKFGFVRMRGILWSAQTGILWTVKASERFHPPPKLARRLSEISTQFWRVLLVLCPLGLLAFFRGADLPARTGQVFIVLYLACWLGFHYLFSVTSERYSFQIMPFAIMLFSAGIFSSIALANKKQPDNDSVNPARP